MHGLGRTLLVALGATALTTTLSAQRTPKLSTVLTTFLADSGVRTRGLPWTTGSALPVRWQQPRPVTNTDQSLVRQGLAQVRSGTIRVAVGAVASVPMTLTLYGNPAGLQRVALSFDVVTSGVDVVQVDQALAADQVTLRPLKCDRSKEGASYGNVAYVMSAAGKTSSALWESWNARHDGTDLTLTILYRRADLAQVECASAS